MVTKDETPAPEPTSIEAARERAEAALRTVIAGSSAGAVRRIVLYALLAAGIALLAGNVLVAAVCMTTLLLLVATDDLR